MRLCIPKTRLRLWLTLCWIADPELKQRIDAFLSERRNKNTALNQPLEEVVHMDVSQD